MFLVDNRSQCNAVSFLSCKVFLPYQLSFHRSPRDYSLTTTWTRTETQRNEEDTLVLLGWPTPRHTCRIPREHWRVYQNVSLFLRAKTSKLFAILRFCQNCVIILHLFCLTRFVQEYVLHNFKLSGSLQLSKCSESHVNWSLAITVRRVLRLQCTTYILNKQYKIADNEWCFSLGNGLDEKPSP